jgi:hypothetical protein
MNTPRSLHSLTRLGGSGLLLAVGGLDGAGNPLASAELYNPVSGTWITLDGALNVPRSEHAAMVTANGALLIIGGRQANGDCLSSVEVFTIPFGGPPTAGTFTMAVNGLSSARASMAAELLSNGTILITGGADGGDAALALAEVYGI